MSISTAKFQFEEYIVTRCIYIHKNINKNRKDYNFSLKPSAILNAQTKQFQLTLDLELSDKDEQSFLNVEITGIFNYEGELDEIRSYLSLNAPALLYPYLRAYVSSVTALSGLGVHTLPTINLSGMKIEIENNIEMIGKE